MMQTQFFLLAFFIFCGIGIVLSCVLPNAWLSKILSIFGSLSGIALILVGISILIAGSFFHIGLWSLPGLTTLALSIDSLSAIFLCVTGLVLFPASIYAGSQIAKSLPTLRHRTLVILLFALYIAITLVLVAGEALLFLFAWEAMSIFSYLLIAQEQPQDEDQANSNFLMLAMGELGTVAAALGFLLLAVNVHSLNFSNMKVGASNLSDGIHWAIFLLSFFGFGVKAGLIPFNFWLPKAYTYSPRIFAPIFAGATLNLGLYGILRLNADIMPAIHIETGMIVMVVGAFSALIGILYATTANDLKTMLAHSSIENAGIVIAGAGAGMIFIATHHQVLAAIAFVTSLYHLINHSFYKTLLFFGTGIIETQAGTRDMDRLGGLIKYLPLTSFCFLVGILSIAALPPFNGFVSEWLTLQTMLRSAELSSVMIKIVFALCGAILALTAALAVTCFVKVFAMTFLGMRRSNYQNIIETSSGALFPLAFLGVLCFALGILPTYVIPILSSAIIPLAKANATDALVPPFFASSPAHHTLPSDFISDFQALGAQIGQNILPGNGLVVLHRGGTENPVVFAMSTSYLLIMLIILLVLTYVIIRVWLTRKHSVTIRERWDGGLRKLLPDMTYTATGFSNPVRVIFDAIFRPTTVEDTKETFLRHFRTAIIREKEHVHLMDKLVYFPLRATALWCADRLAAMHHGKFNTYAAYAFLAMLVVLIAYLWLS
jgi:hydrogenase-4 component B